MILIKELRWSNWFSYGERNILDFTKEPIMQIKGANAQGKSSIAIILQEVLYGKNIKGIKKEDLCNRYTSSKTISADLLFSCGTKDYVLVYERSSKLKLVLYNDSLDISGHTTAQTYKIIQDILGVDFQLFAALTYQATDCKLNFLTDTDTNRKRFLINLLNLSEYLDNQKLFKTKSKEVLATFNQLTGKLSILKSTISKLNHINFTQENTILVPEAPKGLKESKLQLEFDLKDISLTNEKIVYNNELKNSIAELNKKNPRISTPMDTFGLSEELEGLRNNIAQHLAVKNVAITSLKKLEALGDSCPTCLQTIDDKSVERMSKEFTASRDTATSGITSMESRAGGIKAVLSEAIEIRNTNAKAKAIKKEIEIKEASVDTNIAEEAISAKELLTSIKNVSIEIAELEKAIQDALITNRAIETRNTKLEIQKVQLDCANNDVAEVASLLKKEKKLLDNCLVLEETFSMKGLIGYKIESMVKAFQTEINKYLLQLSDGKVKLHFEVSVDKLNVVINNNNKYVGINSLSAGELARVNCSTLLAIRKLLTPINILFLDEIMSVLDEPGREALIDLLRTEKINCFLVDHTYTNPLVPYIEVIKSNNIARIEYGD